MTRPTVRAVIDDGPRAGETLDLDAAAEDTPPKEVLLADEHRGERATRGPVRPPSGAVSTYCLVGRDEERGGYVYRLARRE